MITLSDTTLLQPNPNVVFGDVDGEVVALHIETGNYLHLNSSGSYIFSLLSGTSPLAFGQLCEQVQQAYAVDAGTCKQEMTAFLARCIDVNLLSTAP